MTDSLQRVLLVEDDPDIQAIALIALEDIGGLQVQTCDTGFEALERFPGFAPDLVLLDVMMPGLSGPETLMALRRLPGADRVPVVFMTAKVQKGEVEEYLNLGAVGVIPKPFEPMTLADELRTLAQAHGQQRETEDERTFREQLLELKAEFSQELPGRVAALRRIWASIQRGEALPEALQREAHQLSGTAATFGHPHTAHLAVQLERDPALASSTPPGETASQRVEELLSKLSAAAQETGST
ncbi:response regulator [Deinococcus hopiensis]|uniref:Response regulators consisting of a CheY-like receiver domain and a winged-helix DNA-binding domain n=1 Tax=Deinococcus hopiensis KR-140 TaxID=695939 RepID=A0A1W1UU28_9DEIO|nr:response regulator [Deinococcus hopiensis]SMB84321.1 Response regulators consisting of a CheY-like receiver domain and a winged-helix DNA-binding domain [Deinococcus hopiensis KR-140]